MERENFFGNCQRSIYRISERERERERESIVKGDVNARVTACTINGVSDAEESDGVNETAEHKAIVCKDKETPSFKTRNTHQYT